MERREPKACDACRMAKRRCTKRSPACGRCSLKGLECLYPACPTFIVYGLADREMSAFNAQVNETGSSVHSLEGPQQLDILNSLASNRSGDGNSVCPSLTDLQSAWFLAPEAWAVAPIDLSRMTPICNTVVNRYIAKIRGWLKEWVDTGSNPFIHSQLYKKRLPKSVQHVFTSLSAYFSRNSATEDMIFRIIEEQSNEVVEEQIRSQAQSQLNSFEHMGRVQVLMIYSFIRLFDGDIRQRSLAEKQLPTLRLWTNQMLAAATHAAQDGSLLVSNLIEPENLDQNVGNFQERLEKLLWHAWILSESLRRTWVVSKAIQSIYLTLQSGSTECPGGVMFTTRRGVWEADTAFAWTKMCAERNVGFMHRNDTEKVLVGEKPGEVDHFSLAVMELDFGLEKFQRWGVATASPVELV
ncbi:hypothetical protein B0J13DRAFT_554961 [Dactylonectria estremocensis]|uniref:Zn(2)-C6 fungal-type domain-containing protein n=1 Tax=Dactylonectria estremocensis TaxID=1079267 RepID=A0A9P9J777_9HYPO|nr:hypothetical protein B0J13DRAFT_554961 [Dactylonectria estremocensis]